MKFDELSLALMYRLAGSHSAIAVRVLGAKGAQKEGSLTADARLSVASTHADALISVDEDYVEMAPLSIALPSGRHMVRVQSPGRVSENIEIVLAAGESGTVNATLKDDPIRAVVTEALVRLKDADLAPISEKNADQAIRGRLVTSMPLSEEMLGVAKVSAGEGALVLGEKNIYAVTENSASSNGPLSHVIPYDEFVRQKPTVEHPWLSLMLTARAELSVAGMAIGKKTLIEFLERLRRDLKPAIPAAS